MREIALATAAKLRCFETLLTPAIEKNLQEVRHLFTLMVRAKLGLIILMKLLE